MIDINAMIMKEIENGSLQYRAGIPDPGDGTGDLLCGTAVKAANTVVGSSRGGVNSLDRNSVFSSQRSRKLGVRKNRSFARVR